MPAEVSGRGPTSGLQQRDLPGARGSVGLPMLDEWIRTSAAPLRAKLFFHAFVHRLPHDELAGARGGIFTSPSTFPLLPNRPARGNVGRF